MAYAYDNMPPKFHVWRFHGVRNPLQDAYLQRQQQLQAVQLSCPALQQPLAEPAVGCPDSVISIAELLAAVAQVVPAPLAAAHSKPPALVKRQLLVKFKALLLPGEESSSSCHPVDLLACIQQHRLAACNDQPLAADQLTAAEHAAKAGLLGEHPEIEVPCFPVMPCRKDPPVWKAAGVLLADLRQQLPTGTHSSQQHPLAADLSMEQPPVWRAADLGSTLHQLLHADSGAERTCSVAAPSPSSGRQKLQLDRCPVAGSVAAADSACDAGVQANRQQLLQQANRAAAMLCSAGVLQLEGPCLPAVLHRASQGSSCLHILLDFAAMAADTREVVAEPDNGSTAAAVPARAGADVQLDGGLDPCLSATDLLMEAMQLQGHAGASTATAGTALQAIQHGLQQLPAGTQPVKAAKRWTCPKAKQSTDRQPGSVSAAQQAGAEQAEGGAAAATKYSEDAPAAAAAQSRSGVQEAAASDADAGGNTPLIDAPGTAHGHADAAELPEAVGCPAACDQGELSSPVEQPPSLSDSQMLLEEPLHCCGAMEVTPLAERLAGQVVQGLKQLLQAPASAAALSWDAAAAAADPTAAAAVQTAGSEGWGYWSTSSILARALQLEQEHPLQLPTILLDDMGEAQLPGHSWQQVGAVLQDLLVACRYQVQPTAHLEMYLDWSLLSRMDLGSSHQQLLLMRHLAGHKRSRSAAEDPVLLDVTGQAAAGNPHAGPDSSGVEAPAGNRSTAVCSEAFDAAAWALQHPALARQPWCPSSASASSVQDAVCRQVWGAAVCTIRNLVAPPPASGLQLQDAPLQQPQNTRAVAAAAAADSAQLEGGASLQRHAGHPDVLQTAATAGLQHDTVQAAAQLVSAAANGQRAAGEGAAGAIESMCAAGAPASGAQRGAAADAAWCSSAPAAVKQQQLQPGGAPASDMELLMRLRASSHGRSKSGGAAAAGVLAAQQHVGLQPALSAAPLAATVTNAASHNQPSSSSTHISRVDVTLPPRHVKLLQQLQANRDELLAAHPACSNDLGLATLWDPQPVQLQLQQVQAASAAHGGARLDATAKAANKLLVALLLISQAASVLLHYGIRPSHAFLQHMLQSLPAVAASCAGASTALAAAAEAVERRGLQDHPKQAELRRALLATDALTPGCQVLVVGEQRCMFTLYSAIAAAGLQPVQFDRSNQLLAKDPAAAAAASGSTHAGRAQQPAQGRAAAAAWEAQAKAASSAAQVVLVDPKHALHPCFPLQLFPTIIEYTGPAAASLGGVSVATPAAVDLQEQQAGSAAAAGGAVGLLAATSRLASSCRQYVVISSKPPSDLDLREQQVEDGQHAAKQTGLAGEHRRPSAPVADVRGKPHHPLDTSASTAAHSFRHRQPATSQQPPACAAAAAATQPCPAAAPATELAAPPAAAVGCLVINCSSGRLLDQQRPLYEAMLQLEHQGMQLVERPLGGSSSQPDVVLNPGACLVAFTSAQLQAQALPATINQLIQALLCLSCRYAVVYMLLEAPQQLQAQLLPQTYHLHAWAKEAGVRLQMLVSSSATDTQVMLPGLASKVCRGFWASQGSGPPTMSDRPHRREAIFNTCPSINPLAAAVLAAQPMSLQQIAGGLVSGPLLEQLQQQGVPAHCLQLLAGQLSRVHVVEDEPAEVVHGRGHCPRPAQEPVPAGIAAAAAPATSLYSECSRPPAAAPVYMEPDVDSSCAAGLRPLHLQQLHPQHPLYRQQQQQATVQRGEPQRAPYAHRYSDMEPLDEEPLPFQQPHHPTGQYQPHQPAGQCQQQQQGQYGQQQQQQQYQYQQQQYQQQLQMADMEPGQQWQDTATAAPRDPAYIQKAAASPNGWNSNAMPHQQPQAALAYQWEGDQRLNQMHTGAGAGSMWGDMLDTAEDDLEPYQYHHQQQQQQQVFMDQQQQQQQQQVFMDQDADCVDPGQVLDSFLAKRGRGQGRAPAAGGPRKLARLSDMQGAAAQAWRPAAASYQGAGTGLLRWPAESAADLLTPQAVLGIDSAMGSHRQLMPGPRHAQPGRQLPLHSQPHGPPNRQGAWSEQPGSLRQGDIAAGFEDDVDNLLYRPPAAAARQQQLTGTPARHHPHHHHLQQATYLQQRAGYHQQPAAPVMQWGRGATAGPGLHHAFPLEDAGLPVQAAGEPLGQDWLPGRDTFGGRRTHQQLPLLSDEDELMQGADVAQQLGRLNRATSSSLRLGAQHRGHGAAMNSLQAAGGSSLVAPEHAVASGHTRAGLQSSELETVKPAFMSHRKPTKQLGFKKQGKGRQTQLYWR